MSVPAMPAISRNDLLRPTSLPADNAASGDAAPDLPCGKFSDHMAAGAAIPAAPPTYSGPGLSDAAQRVVQQTPPNPTGKTSSIRFGPGLNECDMRMQRQGDSLIISFSGQSAPLTLHGIKEMGMLTLSFADGSSLSSADFSSLPSLLPERALGQPDPATDIPPWAVFYGPDL